jgi:hypothetical protein
MIEGLSHITFVVSDLDRMTHFLNTIFNAQEIYSSGSRTFSISQEKFFLIDRLWIVIIESIIDLNLLSIDKFCYLNGRNKTNLLVPNRVDIIPVHTQSRCPVPSNENN